MAGFGDIWLVSILGVVDDGYKARSSTSSWMPQYVSILGLMDDGYKEREGKRGRDHDILFQSLV